MSLVDKIKKLDLDDGIDLVARALDTIATLARSSKASHAADILTIIGHIYQAVVDVAEQRITADDARAELQKLVEGIEANDAAADKAVDDKFDNEGE